MCKVRSNLDKSAHSGMRIFIRLSRAYPRRVNILGFRWIQIQIQNLLSTNHGQSKCNKTCWCLFFSSYLKLHEFHFRYDIQTKIRVPGRKLVFWNSNNLREFFSLIRMRLIFFLFIKYVHIYYAMKFFKDTFHSFWAKLPKNPKNKFSII